MNEIISFDRKPKEKTYKSECYCGNCNHIFTIEIELGKLLCHQTYTCPKCACTKEQVEEERLKQQSEMHRAGILPGMSQLARPQ